jgi:hypothetical protein
MTAHSDAAPIDAVLLEDPPHHGRSHRDAQAGQLPRDPPVAPVLVVPGHAQYEPSNRRVSARTAWPFRPGLRRPAALDQVPMPAQDRRGHNRQTQPSMAHTRYHGQQRSEQRRSAQVSFGRAAQCRSRSATWWRSSKISTSFHADPRRESLNHEDRRTTRMNTNRRHIADDHRRAVAKIATRPPR